MCIKLLLLGGVLCCEFFNICLHLTFIYFLRQAALAVMAVTSSSFHQAFLSLLQLHTAQQPFFPSLHFSPALSLHNISPSLCHIVRLPDQYTYPIMWIKKSCFLKLKSRLKDLGLCEQIWIKEQYWFSKQSISPAVLFVPNTHNTDIVNFCPIIFYFQVLPVKK